MKQLTFILIILLQAAGMSMAQEKKVQNRPYTDLRPFHFGIQIGAHVQDIDFVNVGPVVVPLEDGTVVNSHISADQDRFDPGFNVGVLGEFRLNEFFQFRIAPAIYFGSRHLTMRNHNLSTPENIIEQRQDMKTAYISSSFDLIFAAPRLNNHRVYIMAGLMPTLNLTNKVADNLKLTRTQVFAEVGIGIDQYLPYFKCRPELKFQFGLGNAIDTNHINELTDKSMIAYASSVKSARTRMITLTLYFE